MSAENPSQIYSAADGRLQADLVERTVWADGQELTAVTARQLAVLTPLITQPDIVHSHAALTQEILGSHPDDRAKGLFRFQLMLLRKHIGAELGDPETGAIRSQINIGYYMLSSLSGKVTCQPSVETNARSVVDNRLRVYPDNVMAVLDGKILALTLMDFGLLDVLTEHPDTPVYTHEIAERVIGVNNAVTREQVKVRIHKLRQKLGPGLSDGHRGAIITHNANKYHYGAYSIASSLYTE